VKLLLDTNIVLDVMLDRKPHVTFSAKVVAAAETGSIEGSLCATTVTTIHYLATKTLGRGLAAREISRLLEIFRIAPVNEIVLKAALQTKTSDYEDAVLFEAAKSAGMSGIVTRNAVDFPKSNLPIYLPEDVAALLGL
jgi:predicted nucleic acid-binding protein